MGMTGDMSVDKVQSLFDAMDANIMDALSGADFDTLDQMVLGMQLDMAEDFEAIVEALEGARETLVFILE